MAYEIEISSNLSDYARENAEMVTSKVGKFSVDGSRFVAFSWKLPFDEV